MKINIQVEHDNKNVVDSISSSIKERTSMLKDFLSEFRKTQSMSMDKMMSMMRKMNVNKPDNHSSVILQVMRESGKTNQSMIKALKSMADKKESGHKEDMRSMMDTSNSLINAIKDSIIRKTDNKPIVIKTINNKSIDELTNVIRSKNFSGSRFSPSAS